MGKMNISEVLNRANIMTALETSAYKRSGVYSFVLVTVIYIYIYIYTHTHLLTPRSRVLLEKLTGSAASQEIPRIFGTRMFLTVLTSARHLSLS